MGLASDLGLLFILDARDQASEIMDRCQGTLERFGEVAKETAGAVRDAGAQIDEALASTASGADALDLAAARVQAAEGTLAEAVAAQAEAEQALLAARDAAASQGELAAAADEVTAAEDRASAAAGALRDAQAALSEVQDAGNAGADALAAAQGRVAAAEREAAAASDDLSAAQARQDALVTSGDVASAANALTAAERTATAASDDLSAAQARQADVQRAVAASDTEATAAAEKQAAAQKQAAADAEAAQGFLGKASKTAGLISLGMAAAGYESVKAAGNFQDATTHLVTDAGESAKNLAMVQAGILNVSTETGTAASSITDAMYHIESGGFHGAQGLALLKTAAEGARVGGADLDTVSKTLVGAMNAYGMASGNAAKQQQMANSMMNQLIATVGAGDMRMQDLASSLSAVTPVAAAAHIKFSQVGGAIATMTAQGMSADQSTQDLANTIRSLENPSAQSVTEMGQLGLKAQTVASQLGSRGLTGTVQELTRAITSHMGKSGQVIMSAFNKSSYAAQDANIMLQKLPPSIQSVAKGYENGTVSYSTWYSAVKTLPLTARTMATQFATMAGKAHSFNSLLTSGSPAAQTYVAALRKLTGNATSMNTVLMLSGGRMATFEKNAGTIARSAKTAGSNVDKWGTIQSTFNFKMQSAKTAVENTGIAIGTAILPAVTSMITGILHVVEPIAEWTSRNRALTEVLFLGVTAIAATVAVLGAAHKAYKAVTGAVGDMKSAYRGLKKLFGQSAAEQASSAQQGAAAQETASAEAAGAQETDAAEVAAANETAAAETSGSWLASSASMIGSAAKWVVQGLVKVAMLVGENIAGAAATAVAWIAANAAMLLGIGLVVAAVIAAVVLIVTHWKQISAFFESLWHGIVDVAKTAWDRLVSVVTGVWDRIMDFIRSWWPLLLGVVTGPLGLLVGLVIKYHSQIWDEIRKVWNDVLGLIRSVTDRAESVARSAWNGITDLIRIANDVIWSVIYKIWDEIRAFINREVEGIRTILGWFGRLGSLFRGWWDEAVTAIRTAWDRAETFITGIPGRVYSALSALYSDMLTVGTNIVIGIWNGITGKVGWLLGQVEGLGSSVLGGIEHAFGIGSPSKYTAQHGRFLAQGLAVGITQGTPLAVAAAASMARKVLAATAGLGAAGRPAGASLAMAGPAGGGGGTTVILNVTGNTVMSDSDITKLVNKIGKVLGQRVLPNAGRKQRMS